MRNVTFPRLQYVYIHYTKSMLSDNPMLKINNSFLLLLLTVNYLYSRAVLHDVPPQKALHPLFDICIAGALQRVHASIYQLQSS